jgi:hypothetical protein
MVNGGTVVKLSGTESSWTAVLRESRTGESAAVAAISSRAS